MFIWLVGLIVFLVSLGLLVRSDEWSVIVIVLSFLIGMVGSILALLASFIVGGCVPQTAINEVSRSEIQLIALKDNMAVDGYYGGRYVYRGYIGEELQYTFLYKEKDKGVTSGRCDADKTYINYIKDAEQPKLIIVEYNVTHPVWKFFSANDIGEFSHRYEYYLYVPEGSIIAEGQYEVDLE